MHQAHQRERPILAPAPGQLLIQPQEQLGAEGWELVAPGDEPADRSANLDAPAFAWLRRLMGT